MTKLAFNKLKITEAIWLPHVPDHWELVKVRHLFKESTKKGFPNETLLVASQERGVVSKDAYGKRTVEATKDLHNLKLVEQGDFVISLRSFQGGIEVAHERGIISPAYTVIKETRRIEKRYFKNLFKSPPFISLMTLCVKGIREGQNIDYPTFKNEYLPFPPLEEQQVIAAYLDKKNKEIDRFIRNKKRFIELMNEEKKSIIYNAVTKGVTKDIQLKESGDLWNGKIPAHWELVKFNHYINLRHGHQFRDFDFKAEGIKVVKITQLTFEGNLELSECSFVDSSRISEFKDDVILEGDILMALTGGTIGKIIRVKVVNEILLQNYRVGNFNPSNNKKLDKDFLFWLLSSSVIFDQIMFAQRETGQPNIGKGDLGKMCFALPPLDDQREIVKHIFSELEPFETAIIKTQKEISSIKEYREALITDLVTGKRSVPQFQMS